MTAWEPLQVAQGKSCLLRAWISTFPNFGQSMPWSQVSRSKRMSVFLPFSRPQAVLVQKRAAEEHLKWRGQGSSNDLWCPHDFPCHAHTQLNHHPACLGELPRTKEEMVKFAQFPAARPWGSGSIWAKLSWGHGIYNTSLSVNPCLLTIAIRWCLLGGKLTLEFFSWKKHCEDTPSCSTIYFHQT